MEQQAGGTSQQQTSRSHLLQTELLPDEHNRAVAGGIGKQKHLLRGPLPPKDLLLESPSLSRSPLARTSPGQ